MPYARVKNELPLIPGYASGDIVTIEAAAAPLNKCVVDILNVQSGTGDPSPMNIRPISGWSSVNVTVNDGQTPPVIENVNNIPLGTTVYGGTLDVVSGVLTKKYEKYKLGSSGWVESSGRYQHRYEGIMKSGSYYLDKGAICDTYPKLETLASGTGLVFGYNSDYLYFYIKDDFPTIADWTTYLENNDVYVTMPLETPITIQLTPQEVNTILGQNNIFADSGDIDIIYIRRNDT